MAWKDLTERQKQLDRAIDKAGVKIENTRTCLSQVMSKIGAKEDEADYVLSRIQLRIRTQQILDETDDFICRTEKMLGDFVKDDAEREKIKRKLGLNFRQKM